MEKLIGNKRVYQFVKKYNKEQWDNAVELLCLVGINALKGKEAISLKELKDIAEGKGKNKGGYAEINQGKNGNEMGKHKERGKSAKSGNVKGNIVYRKGNEGKSNVNVVKNKKENNNMSIKGKKNDNVDTHKQPPQRKEQLLNQDPQPLEANVSDVMITSTSNTKQQPQTPSSTLIQPLTTYQPSYNYLSQSYTYRNNDISLNTTSPCYNCHNHFHCQHHHYHCSYHCQHHHL